MARQRTFFHKCHRCIYRGQPANWEPAEAPLAMLNVHAAEEPGDADVKTVEIQRAEPPRKPKKGAKPAAAPKTAPKTVDASI